MDIETTADVELHVFFEASFSNLTGFPEHGAIETVRM